MSDARKTARCIFAGITPISDAIAMCFNSLRSHLKFSYEKNNNNTKMGVPGPLNKQYIVPSLIRYRLMNLVFIVFFCLI